MMEKAGNSTWLPEGTTPDDYFLEDGRYVSSWQPLKTYSPSVKWPEGWEVQLNPRRSSHASALDEWWRFVQVKTDSSAGVGDVNSNAKGSGARYNSGKPDLSQFDLRLLSGAEKSSGPVWMRDVLHYVGAFQMAKIEGRDRTLQTVSLRFALDTIPDAFRSAARVFSYGEKKYARYNWMKGTDWNIPIACIGRHALAILEGEETDTESGEPHAGHIACNIIMLLHYLDYYPEGDNRPCAPE